MLGYSADLKGMRLFIFSRQSSTELSPGRSFSLATATGIHSSRVDAMVSYSSISRSCSCDVLSAVAILDAARSPWKEAKHL